MSTVTLRSYRCSKCDEQTTATSRLQRRGFGTVIESRSDCCSAPVITIMAQEVEIADATVGSR